MDLVLFLIIIKCIFAICYYINHKFKINIELGSLFQSIVFSVASHYIVFTNHKHIFDLNVPEDSPHLWMYKYIPVFAIGYGFYDLFDAIMKRSIEFYIHGIVIVSTGLIAFTYNKPNLLIPLYLTETSTIFLNLRKKHPVFAGLFALTFFIYRIVLSPYNLYRMLVTIKQISQPVWYVCIVLSMTLMSLNIFWFIKILKYLLRLFRKNENRI